MVLGIFSILILMQRGAGGGLENSSEGCRILGIRLNRRMVVMRVYNGG